MKRLFSILSLLIISLGITEVFAQDITISSIEFVKLKNDVQRLEKDVVEKDLLLKVRTDSCNILKSQTDSLKYECDSLGKVIINNNADIIKLKNDTSKYIGQLQTMQETLDDAVARLANGRLMFKYDDEFAQTSIKSLKEIKTEKIKERFAQVLELLQKYKTYSEDVKTTLSALQSIKSADEREWKNKYRVEEYQNHCISILKQSHYYQNVYTKKNPNSWSIPYLDNIINAAQLIIKKHDPLKDELANFSPLIEML